MLKPLLLLCCAAIFVSAGDQTDTSIPNNVAGHAVTQPELSSTSYNKVPTLSNNLTHVSSVSIESPMNSSKSSNQNAETKSNALSSAVTTLDEHNTMKPITSSITAASTPSTTSSSITPTTPTKSTPSTTAVPTTSAPTTPVPPPSTKKWIVKKNNTVCIIVQMAAQFNFTYTKDKVTIHKLMDIPNGTVTGVCGKNEQYITILWKAPKDANNSFTLHFLKNETQKHYSFHDFEISLAPQEFPNYNSNETIILTHTAPRYDIALSNSYRCFKQQKLDLYIQGKNESVGQFTVTNLQFQAFRSDNATVFGLAKDCAFDTPDIVPITVGCALAGLVVIVLFAYLVGRRRSQARGYLSM